MASEVGKYPGYLIHAGREWVTYHEEHSIGEQFAYARRPGARMENVERGGYVFFLPRDLKFEQKTVAFCGQFLTDEIYSVEAAWKKFGTALGAEDLESWLRNLSAVSKTKEFLATSMVSVIEFGFLQVPQREVMLSESGVQLIKYSAKGHKIEATDVRSLLQLFSRPAWDVDYDESESYEEGKRILRIHKAIERNPKLIADAKIAWLKKDPSLSCSVCGFSFKATYGDRGCKFIEAHHKVPLSKLGLKRNTNTRIADLVPLCSNCHRMMHKSPETTVHRLKKDCF